MLIFSIPSSSDHGESAVDRRFQDSESGALNHEAGEVVAGAHAGEDNAPDDYAACDVFCWWEDLEKSVVDRHCGHITSIIN